MRGWSDLPLARWSFLALADQMMQYLSRRADSVFNYNAGDDVIVHVDAATPISKYLLRKPGLQQLPGEVKPGARLFAIRDADQLGHYEVVGGEAGSKFSAGFSVNASPAESDFQRLTEEDRSALLGEKRYSVARNIQGLEKVVDITRIGVEIYPLLLGFLLMVFCTEHIVANHFYAAEQAVET
jgi:hypothetical protein